MPTIVMTPRARSERGAIVIQVVVSFWVLTAFLIFVVDYGIKWVARAQAQNSADAAALAGAVALALDNPTSSPNPASAVSAAQSFAWANDVWGEDPSVVASDVAFSGVNPADFPAECAPVNCVRVRVYRSQERANALPLMFGSMLGLTEQGVRATAIARAIPANASTCLKPWALADRWNESDPGGLTPASEFTPATGDTYVPPTPGDPGTGFTPANDLGQAMSLHAGPAITPGWFQAVDLSGGPFAQNISGCAGPVWRIGDSLPAAAYDWPSMREGTENLIAMDPLAEWDAVNERIVNSCAQASSCVDGEGNPVAYAHSPRLVSVPVFDLAEFVATGGPGVGQVRVVNIVGFFVEAVDDANSAVAGRLALKSDTWSPGAGAVASEASFIKAIQLVR